MYVRGDLLSVCDKGTSACECAWERESDRGDSVCVCVLREPLSVCVRERVRGACVCVCVSVCVREACVGECERDGEPVCA